MRVKPLLLASSICALLFAKPVIAQLQQAPRSSAEILADLEKLNVLGSVLYFAAHPDDENTRLIAWSAREMKYRTGYLSLTRGDGGQNLIGTELAEELGLIRTQELLAARGVDGGEQYFSRANDFGFSKTPDETLAFWGEEAILADAVWVIRNLKPDVIITRFPPDPRAGHGHHQSATILAIQAFEAAADPTRFPDQLKYVEPWQAKRLLWNAANFGGQNSITDTQLKMEVGAYNPLLGQSYGEISAASRSNHKSQGFGAASQRGIASEYFELMAGEPAKSHIMDGVDVTWSRVKGGEGIAKQIQNIIAQFQFQKPEAVVPNLIELLNKLEKLEDGYWKDQKIKELKDIILACAGIWVESYAETPKIAQGQALSIRTDAIVRRPGVQVEVLTVDEQLCNIKLTFNTQASVRSPFQATQTTQPYWLRYPKVQERFRVEDLNEIGRPENPDAPKTRISLSVNGKEITIERLIAYKYTHPVGGEIHQPLIIAPAVTANAALQTLVFSTQQQSKTVDVVFASHADKALEVTVTPKVPAGWTVTPAQLTLKFEQKDQEIIGKFTLTHHQVQIEAGSQGPQRLDKEELAFELIYSQPYSGQSVKELAARIRTIDYQHIPLITYFPSANIKLSYIHTGVSVQRIGYIVGAGDLVPEALRQIGITVDILSEQDILEKDLSTYDAIISGIRAYNVNRRMGAIEPKIMDYVAAGGTYLMQYNVNSGLFFSNFGPYPFKLSRLRVTDETAEVRFLLPQHQVLNYPNRLNSSDFQGWVQERGLYFAADIDSRYELPFSMNDPGEDALDGSVLVGRHGKGKFVYTSLAFFRQLPAGVPGAYRLFVNLLAKPSN